MKMFYILLLFICSNSFALDFTASSLHSKLEVAGIPIDGVSIGKASDKATWRIDFKLEATPEQRAAAQQVLQDFDPATISNAPSDDVSWLKWAVDKLAPGVAGAGAAAVVLSAAKRKDIPKDDPTASPIIIEAEESKPL